MTRFVAIPGASEIFLLCLVVNKNLPSKHEQLFCLGFFFFEWQVAGILDMKLAVIGLWRTDLVLLFGQRVSEEKLSE